MAEQSPERESREQRQGGTGTILVVEDEPDGRRSLERVLRAHGHTVVTVEDGMAALEWYRAHHGEVGLVLSDLVMPRMGGHQLYESLRRSSDRSGSC
jgi:CheY-like chemotaxis protein